MTIWKHVLDALPSWPWRRSKNETDRQSLNQDRSNAHVEQARESLQTLLDDPKIPAAVRRVLACDFSEIQAMLDKLENSHIHIAVFGRVGVGKSALLNALLGEKRFSTSPLHGETRRAQSAAWEEWEEGGVFLIDTPGINDVEGEERERHTHAAINRSDLILFVVDGDLSSTELSALQKLLKEHRPVVLVLNKGDLYTLQDKRLLLQQLKQRTAGLIPDSRIVIAAASPADRVYLQVDDKGQESMTTRATPPVVDELRYTLWSILETEGKTLAALNASLFAGKLSDAVNQRILAIKKDLAEKLIRNYCILKGAVVGLNPIPISDLVAAGAVDVSLVLHLGRIYGLPIDYSEAGKLIRTIGAQMALIMGSVWAVHFIASALKGGTAGLSTVLTAATQGAVAYYSAYVVGETAQTYFAQGRSWGPKGPKRVVQDILDNLDRDSLLADARQQILARLRAG